MLRRVKHRDSTLEKKKYIFIAVSKGYSYQQIGIDLGISRQRVHQIYKDYRTGYPKDVQHFLDMVRDAPCEICQSTENIIVHHIDKNREHNGAYNLMSLCKNCHYSIHKKRPQ